MATDGIQNSSWVNSRMEYHLILSLLNHLLLTYFASFSFSGWFVNSHIIRTNRASSSPSHVIATKGSSAWLHWDYTYTGDGTHGRTDHFVSKYKKQIVGFSSESQSFTQVLAMRVGQNGALTLKSSIPAPFNGRVDVIASNSTLVIHNLQYSDSTYQFLSEVKVDVNMRAYHGLHVFRLQPIVSLTVIGTPEFTKEPPREVEVNEHSPLVLRIEMEGNPKPRAYFKWTHHSSLSVLNASSARSNQSRYHATYEMVNADASFCGRRLQINLRNNIGSSTTKQTRVIVLLKLEQALILKAERLPGSECIKVNWMKIESAECVVKYVVKLKDAYGTEVDERYGYNIDGMKVCNILPHVRVTEVQLIAQFRAITKAVTAIVEGEVMFPSKREICTTQGTNYSSVPIGKFTRHQLIDEVSPSSVNVHNRKPESSLRSTTITIIVIGSLVILLLVIFVVFLISKMTRMSDKRKRKPRRQTTAKDTFKDLLPQSSIIVQIYADLENEYEEIQELRA